MLYGDEMLGIKIHLIDYSVIGYRTNDNVIIMFSLAMSVSVLYYEHCPFYTYAIKYLDVQATIMQ